MWVGGTIYNTHTLKPFKELGLDSQTVKKLASKLHVHSVDFAAVHTRRAFSSTVINSHQETVSGQVCNPLDPLDYLPFPFTVEELYAIRYQSGEWFFTACAALCFLFRKSICLSAFLEIMSLIRTYGCQLHPPLD